MSEHVCVLTGDLVRSSALSRARLDAVMAALADAAERIDGWADAASPAFERFQGDGWQMLVAAPRHALRAALYLRAAVRKTDAEAETRIAIAVGQARLADRLAASSGDAFELSGRVLDTLRNRRYWAIDGALGEPRAATLACGLIAVCDALSQRWTARQAEVVMALIEPEAPTMRDLAVAQEVQPQTVQAHFAVAGGPALVAAVEAFERSIGDE